MAHYAFIDENNIVTQVIVGKDEDEAAPEPHADWESYYGELIGGTCLRTSYNTRANQHDLDGEPFRGNYAGIGFEYMPELDIFMPSKPFESWVLDEAAASWVAPVPMPEDGEVYSWDEESGSWIAEVQ